MRPLPRRLVEKAKSNSLKESFCAYSEANGEPDVLYAHFPLLTLTDEFLDMLELKGVPLVTMEHWTHVARETLKPHELRLLNRVAEQAVTMCCVSDDLAHSLARLTGVPLNRIPVIPNAIDESCFYWDDNAERQKGLFLAVGRLVKAKKFDLLIKAFSEAFPSGKERLLIAGGGYLAPYLRYLAAKSWLVTQFGTTNQQNLVPSASR